MKRNKERFVKDTIAKGSTVSTLVLILIIFLAGSMIYPWFFSVGETFGEQSSTVPGDWWIDGWFLVNIDPDESGSDNFRDIRYVWVKYDYSYLYLRFSTQEKPGWNGGIDLHNSRYSWYFDLDRLTDPATVFGNNLGDAEYKLFLEDYPDGGVEKGDGLGELYLIKDMNGSGEFSDWETTETNNYRSNPTIIWGGFKLSVNTVGPTVPNSLDTPQVSDSGDLDSIGFRIENLSVYMYVSWQAIGINFSEYDIDRFGFYYSTDNEEINLNSAENLDSPSIGVSLPIPLAGISVEKYTNGFDADFTPGPYINEGDTVVWTYNITNTGSVDLFNIVLSDDKLGIINLPNSNLSVGERITISKNDTAVAGQYWNTANVSASSPVGPNVSNSDSSHYFGASPSITIEKFTNGFDADNSPGPYILVGENVEWTYNITNTGNIYLTCIVVNDDQGVTVVLPKTSLQPGEWMIATADGIATIGQYKNTATVSAWCQTGTYVLDSDSSHYFGTSPSITIEKFTNGFDADDPTGPYLISGQKVTWTYNITNTGNTPLSEVVLFDDQLGTVSLPQSSLAVDESIEVNVDGKAVIGQYINNATVTAECLCGAGVSDSDKSHYFGSGALINGVAFLDADGDGLRDQGEIGIPNIKITLNNTLAETDTSTNGKYYFAINQQGKYNVTADLVDGFFRTTPKTVFLEVVFGNDYFVDFGYAPSDDPFGVAYGTVFNDTNHDGSQDIGEYGIPGVTVSLYNSTDMTYVNDTTTNANGMYTLRVDLEGNYTIIETDPAEYVSTTPNEVNTTLVTGSSNDSPYDFGDFKGAAIYGVIFNDTNVNGLYDKPDESPVPDAIVSSDSVNFTSIGSFDFLGGNYRLYLVPGEEFYYVVETDPPGYLSTNAIPDPLNPNMTRIDANSVNITYLEYGEYYRIDFGDVLASNCAEISGYVFEDINANGQWDEGESGLAGARVVLSSGLAQTTDSSGSFLLYAPPYVVVNITEINPDGYVSTNAIPGFNASKVNNDHLTVNVTQPVYGVYKDNLFGDVLAGSVVVISGVVFDDEDENGVFNSTKGEQGIPGVKVSLEIDGGSTINVTTDTEGTYQFVVAPGTDIRISSLGPSGSWYPTTLESIFLSPPAPGLYPDNNFGYSNDSDVAVIYGLVFDDVNGNGQHEMGEIGVLYANVSLYHPNSTFLGSMNNTWNGTFAFIVDETGIYRVNEQNLPGWRSTTPDDVKVPVLALGQSYYVEFGDTTKSDTASIYGTVFNDADGNGVQDPGEPGLSGVNITLLLNGVIINKTTTKSYGQYIYGFEVDEPGYYQVVETDLPGWFSTTPNEVQVFVTLGESYRVNFGDIEETSGFSSIYGTVFADEDADGTWDSGEPGIQGVTVILFNGSDFVASNVTGTYGGYSIKLSVTGTYTVVCVADGWHSTTPSSVSVEVELGQGYKVDFGNILNEPPVIVSVVNDPEPPLKHGEPTVVYVNVSDDVGVDVVIIEWESSVAFMLYDVESNLWYYMIPGQPAGTSFTVMVTAVDADGATSSSTFNKWWTDQTTPIIVSIVNDPEPPLINGESTLVLVNASDDVGVDHVTIEWIGSGILEMIYDETSGLWMYTIPGYSAGTSFVVNVTAYDVAGNFVVESFSKWWTDQTSPIILNVTQSNDDPPVGEDVTITAHVIDNVAIKNVTISYNDVDYIMTFDSGNLTNGFWIHIIEDPGEETTIVYTVTAYDMSDNQAVYGPHGKHWHAIVQPEISLWPTLGYSDTTVYGKGFTANSKITLVWNETTIDTSPIQIKTDNQGEFTAIINRIPEQASPGTYIVTANDELGNWNSAIFTSLQSPKGNPGLEGETGQQLPQAYLAGIFLLVLVVSLTISWFVSRREKQNKE
jgi:hypothetical protein